MNPTGASIQEIKTKLDEAEAELARLKALKNTLGAEVASETVHKLQDQIQKTQAKFESLKLNLWELFLEDQFVKELTLLDEKLTSVNQIAWQNATGPLEIFRKIDLPILEKLDAKARDLVLEVCQKRLLLMILQGLSMPEQGEFIELLAKQDPSKALEYLKQKKPELNLLAAEEAERIKKELLEILA